MIRILEAETPAAVRADYVDYVDYVIIENNIRKGK